MHACILLLAFLSRTADDEKVFSGPQVGEKLGEFTVRGVYDDAAGKDLDFVKEAEGKPLLLIFVHQLTRPSAGVTRALAQYAQKRKEDGLAAGIVWLTADPADAENYLKRARQSLDFKVPVGITTDGIEGPGALGLNRNVTLTILVAKENKVTANFALVQPSLTEAPKILAKVVELIGGDPPTLEELQPAPPRKRRE